MKISKSLYIWSLLGSLITFFAWHMGLANIDILKGTYSILKDDYKHLSIIHGAVATEKDYLMKLYDYGSLGKAVKIDVTGVDYDVPDVKNSSAIVQLVHLFFHRANPLSTGRGDFALTKSLGVLDLEGKKSFVTVMAWLLGSADFKIAHEDAGDIKIEKTIQKIWTPVSKASGNTITFSKIVGFVNQAVTQSRGFNAVFDVPSIYMVLLSMVYKIAATDKSLIKLFYEKLDEQTKKIKKDSIFVDGKISDDWVNEKFSPANAVEFEQSIKAFDFKDVANIVNSYEKIVYLSLLPGDYPTVAPYGEAYFYYDPKDKKKFVNIPDCMENVLRNMLNVIFYNKGKGEFDISDAVKKLKISPKLKPLIFYKKYKNVLDVDLQEVHNSWMYVVSNIPFVAYYHCVGRKERGSKFGYIKIPSDVLDKEFFGKHYIEVSQEDIVYEVGPSLRNMIIIFNNLLGLGLFEKEAGNTENQKIGNAFKRDDFVKYYFPELCKKLKIDFYGWDHKVEDVDKFDQSVTAIDTLLKFRETSEVSDFKLTTRLSHGEFKSLVSATKKEFLTSSDCLKIEDKRIYTLPDLYCSLNFDAILADFKKEEAVALAYLLKVVFWLPIDNSDFVKQLIESLNSINDKLVDLLIYLVNKIRDVYIRNKVFGELVEKGKGFEQAIDVAFHEIKSKDYNISSGAIDLFGELVEKGKGFEQVINLARQQITSEQDYLKVSAIKLFKLLVDKGRKEIFGEALKASADGIKNENVYILYASKTLLISLLNKGQEDAFKEALNVARQGINSKNNDTLWISVELFEYLVGHEREDAFEDAAKAAYYGMQSNNADVRSTSIEIFRTLVANNRENALEEAIKAASLGMKSADSNVLCSSIELFRFLVDDNRYEAFGEALRAASLGIKSEDVETLRQTIELFRALVAQNREEVFEEAIKAASHGVNSKEVGIIAGSNWLFIDLVGKDREAVFEQAIKVASHGIKSEDGGVCTTSLYLFKTLFAKIKQLLEKQIDERNVSEVVIQLGKKFIEGASSSNNQEVVDMAKELQDKLATLQA